jgi:hypothetical protein
MPPRKRQPAPVVDGEVVDTGTATIVETRPITFTGRTMKVREPTPEQIIVWNLLRRQVRDMEAAGDTPERNRLALDVLTTGTEILQGLMVDQDDQGWLLTQFARARLTLQEAMGIMSATVDAFATEPASPNGAQPKARRR